MSANQERRSERCEITCVDLGFLFARPVIFFLLSPRRRLPLQAATSSNCAALKGITAPQRPEVVRTSCNYRLSWLDEADLHILCFHCRHIMLVDPSFNLKISHSGQRTTQIMYLSCNTTSKITHQKYKYCLCRMAYFTPICDIMYKLYFCCSCWSVYIS